MEQAEKTMMDNLLKNTGKSLQQWIDIVQKNHFDKHSEIIKFLKDQHSFTYGFANFVALKARKTDAASAENMDSLIDMQYKGKENLKPIYDKLLSEILQFGNDIEIAPKNAYVSLKRKKQFATLQPAAKSRFEIGLNIKGQEPKGVLEIISTTNAMCSHKINLVTEKDITKEVLDWIKTSYNNAG